MPLLSLRSELCPFLWKQLVKKVNLNVKRKEKGRSSWEKVASGEAELHYVIKDTARR